MINQSQVDSLAARLKLRHMQVAIALRDAPSARDVAQRLNVSESAISKTLAELESLLGFRLFERIGNEKHPTEMGRQVLPTMEALLLRARSMAEMVLDVRSGHRGNLAIGVATDAGKLHLSPLIHAFNQAHPDVDLDVEAGSYRAMVDKLRDGALHAVVCYDSSELIDPALDRLQLVAAQPLRVVANARLSPLAGRRRLTVPDLHGQPWCKPRLGTMMHTRFVQLFQACNLGLPPLGIQVSDLWVIDAFVRGTGYLAMLPEQACQRLADTAGAAILRVDLGIRNVPIVATWRRVDQWQPALQRFLQCCGDSAGKA